MKNIFLIMLLGIISLTDSNGQNDTSRIQLYVYPEFLMPIDVRIGETKIILYNFDKEQNKFTVDIFEKYARNFNTNTFYIKKIVESQNLDLSGSWEYFRTGNNQWNEVSISHSGFKLREIIVTEETALRDTSTLFTPDTYEDVYHIIDYRRIK